MSTAYGSSFFLRDRSWCRSYPDLPSRAVAGGKSLRGHRRRDDKHSPMFEATFHLHVLVASIFSELMITV